MKLKELAEIILRFNDNEGLSIDGLRHLKAFASDSLKYDENIEPTTNDMPEYQILTTQGQIEFTGKYRLDLETNNWHYYEKDDGTIIHFRKEHMVAVIGETAESIKAN